MIVVNLFGAPGAGKSTLALLVAGLLKTEHPDLTTECPDEIAKLAVYDESLKALSCQIYIAGKQQWQVARCEGHADIVVCDSPILLSWVYGSEAGSVPIEFFYVCKHYHEAYPSLNYRVERNHAFEIKARVHTADDEGRLDRRIRNALDAATIKYANVHSTPEDAHTIASAAADLARSLRVND